MVEIYWNNKQIIPYESFYWTQTERFFHGTCGDGNSRTVDCNTWCTCSV